ncbi:hypothetical protein Phou_078770 [Phytohabitans houttuyneae]|uniref:Uncharacterized protein n=1 Tax=Phytohabitans houttuyneae TaxID=1076126 RepID=A0A6V8KPM9_9ACTN|nr:hypothetical protein Phou_078770 [Phytohabitans houttuyneae]
MENQHVGSDPKKTSRGRGGGAGAALVPTGWTAAAKAGAAAPPQVLAAGDLALWYDEPAGADWLRALPIGNGRLGAMVFGNIDTERLQLNEDTIWAGGPYDSANTRGAANLAEIRRRVFADQWTQAQDLINQTMMGTPGGQLAYQTVGNLRLAFGSASGATQYNRTLDLTTATATTAYVLNGVRYQRDVFASAPDQVIVTRLTADRANSITFNATFDSPQRTTVSSPDSTTIGLDGISGTMEGITGQVRFLALASAVATGGTVSSSGGTLRVSGATSVTVLVSIGSSYVNFRTVNGDYQGIARSRLSAARTVGYDQLRARHVADYQALFNRVTIDLGRTAAADQTTDVRIAQHASVNDPQFSALLFQYGRYLLISSSRPGTQPANLQGIWNEEMAPAWDSKYTINANLPMNYWPADTTNLAECFLPVFDMIKDLTVTGARVAQAQYGAGGWVTHHNTDAWRGASVVDGALWGMWQTGGAWLATMIWDHYLFTGNLDFLRANYPAMKGAAQFFLDTLVTHPTLGHLVTNPSNSPELPHHANASVCAGPTMDNQILRDLFTGCARASEVLGVDTTFRTQVLAARDRLPPMRVGSRGNIQEWLADWVETERNHRHVSHLYGLHPSNQITRRGHPSCTRPPGRHWSCAGTTAPAGHSPGRSTTGRGWKTAPAPTSSSATWCAPTGSRRTCSTCTRRSRSTATSAPPPASPRCFCRATTVSCTCCPRCRPHGRRAASRACAAAAGTRSVPPGAAAGPSSPSRPTAPAPSGCAAGSSPAPSSCATRRAAPRYSRRGWRPT